MTDLSLSPHTLEGLDLIDRIANSPPQTQAYYSNWSSLGTNQSDAIPKGADALFEKPTPVQEIIATARKFLHGVPTTKKGVLSQ
jgi:hypothetical protein